MTCPRCAGTLIPDECDDRDELTVPASQARSIEYVCLGCSRRFNETLEQMGKHEEVEEMRSTRTSEEWDALCWPLFEQGKSVWKVSIETGHKTNSHFVAQSRIRWGESRGGYAVITTPKEQPVAKKHSKKPKTHRTPAEVDAVFWPLFADGLSPYRASKRLGQRIGSIARNSCERWKKQSGIALPPPIAPTPIASNGNCLEAIRTLTLQDLFAGYTQPQREGLLTFAAATWGRAA